MSTGLQEREILLKSTDARPDRIASVNPDDFSVPSGREEEWRYTPLKRVANLHVDVAASTNFKFDVEANSAINHKLVNKLEINSNFLATDRITARAFANTKDALVISIPKEFESQELIWVKINLTTGVQYSHIKIEAGQHSKSTVVLEYIGEGIGAINSEIEALENSKIDVINIFDASNKSVLVSEQQFILAKDATVRTMSVELGSDVLRYIPRAKFSGPHASIDLFGVFLATNGQFFENRVFVDHNMKDCRSNVLYRGGAQGEGSHTVWVGDVLIRKVATGTDTYEMNRNLLLDDGARADSVPNLEIETGEVQKAGHASVTGRLDDDQLFYLMSRGIDEHTARQLVIEGFFSGIFGEFSDVNLKEKLTEKLNAAIERANK